MIPQFKNVHTKVNEYVCECIVSRSLSKGEPKEENCEWSKFGKIKTEIGVEFHEADFTLGFTVLYVWNSSQALVKQRFSVKSLCDYNDDEDQEGDNPIKLFFAHFH